MVIAECPACSAPIRGRTHVPRLGGGIFKFPAYCLHCGKPFPWTESAIAAAREYADGLDLSTEDKTDLKGTFDDLTSDTPRMPAAASKFKKIVEKAGPVAVTVLQKIFETVASEGTKKLMGGF
jgi:hypothetical protein